MNVFDQFMKHKLQVKEYVRYTDDFVTVASERGHCERHIEPMKKFLQEQLRLTLHPKKFILRNIHQGIDFLGTIIFPHHRLIRTRTRRRMFVRLARQVVEYRAGARTRVILDAVVQSYLSALGHANTYRLSEELKNQYWFLLTE